MNQFYNIETFGQENRTRIKVFRSIQHNPYERELTISPQAAARLEKIAPGEIWYVAPPTPYHPKAIFVLRKETHDADTLTAMMDKHLTDAERDIVHKHLDKQSGIPKPVTDLYAELDAAEWCLQLSKLSDWEATLVAAAAVHGFKADDYRLDIQTRWATNAYMKCPATKDWKSIGEQIGKAVKDEAALARLEDARLEAANRLKIKL